MNFFQPEIEIRGCPPPHSRTPPMSIFDPLFLRHSPNFHDFFLTRPSWAKLCSQLHVSGGCIFTPLLSDLNSIGACLLRMSFSPPKKLAGDWNHLFDPPPPPVYLALSHFPKTSGTEVSQGGGELLVSGAVFSIRCRCFCLYTFPSCVAFCLVNPPK